MNCLETRRALLTDPASRTAGIAEHVSSCAACAAEAARSAQLERVLREAVSVPIPEGLASRVLLRQEFSDGSEVRRARWPLGLAAAIGLLAVGALVGLHVSGDAVRPLDSEVVALIGEAPYALSATEPLPGPDVAAALRPVGVALDGAVGEITFASRCFVRGKLAGHLVLQGETAPVTVFLIPHAFVEERADVRSATLEGVVLPDRLGTIAIVGAPGEQLAAIESMVRAAVRWPA